MPTHVALEHLDDVAGFRDEASIGLHIAERRQLELQRAETFRESDLLFATEMLPGENEQRVLQPRTMKFAPRRVIERGQLHTGH